MIVERKNVKKENKMDPAELEYQLNQLPNKFDFLASYVKKQSVEIHNEVMEHHAMFILQLVMTLITDPTKAYSTWEEYFKSTIPEYANAEVFALFKQEVYYRDTEEKKFRKELGSL
jgi:nanoRNase/pAp phosphatase (c-di-AMP/oligoRNAs hydrolase)